VFVKDIIPSALKFPLSPKIFVVPGVNNKSPVPAKEPMVAVLLN
jgi:hypothetical protein